LFFFLHTLIVERFEEIVNPNFFTILEKYCREINFAFGSVMMSRHNPETYEINQKLLQGVQGAGADSPDQLKLVLLSSEFYPRL
jgi:hypothetical protein